MKLDDIIDALDFPAMITEVDAAEMRASLVNVRAALVSLSTNVHFSARDRSGESSTRRVQTLAASALRGEPSDDARSVG